MDTGFSDFLALPYETIAALRLEAVTSVAVILGDGSEVTMPFFQAIIVWDGRERRVYAHASNNGPLIGMGLLDGFHLGMDVTTGGQVTIAAIG